MANVPDWWKQGTPPAPTKPKKPKKKAPIEIKGANMIKWDNWNVFPDMYLPADPITVPEQPMVKSPGQLLYEMRVEKGSMLGLGIGWNNSSATLPWESIPNVSKESWEMHASSTKGHWEKWCYENNDPMPYALWRAMNGLPAETTPQWLASSLQAAASAIRTPKEIRCLNRPGEKHVI